MLSASLLVAALVLSVYASPTPITQRSIPETHTVHERHEPHWANHWSKHERLSAKTILPLRIGLKHDDEVLIRGHDLLMDIADPKSPNYGKHMTAEEVVEFFAPSGDAVDAISDWITSSGIDRNRVSLSDNKQWIQLDATVEEAENLLLAEYFLWEHHASESVDISCEEYHLPKSVQKHVDYVLPGIRMLPRAGKRGVTASRTSKRAASPVQHHPRAAPTVFPNFPEVNSTSCNSYVVPECIKTQYGIPNGTTARSGNALGIYSSDNEHYGTTDLNQYWDVLYPTIPDGTKPQDVLIDGAVSPANPSASPAVPIGSGETNLDVELAWPIIWPQEVVVYQVDDQWYEFEEGSNHAPQPPRGTYNTFLDALDGSYCTYSAFGETGDCLAEDCKDPVYPDNDPNAAAFGFPESAQYKGERQCGVYTPTNVISISYSLPEYLLPAFYMQRQCNEWMKLGLQGVTVVVASGDQGVGENFNCQGPNFDIFTPFYISTCPYVLSVGATELNTPAGQQPAPGQKLSERATTTFGSGGGFSNVFDRPSYQDAAVSNYLTTANLPFGSYTQFVNESQFDNITTGVYRSVGRAYPDVSAVGERILITIDGAWQVVAGTSASTPIWAGIITLINEARLATGKGTVGFINPTLYANPQVFNDITVGSNPGCNMSGFPATVGWDPATGLGSPNYPLLFELLTS